MAAKGASSALFSDIHLTPSIHLSHRAIGHLPKDCHAEYYGQRASSGGLLITEATAVSETSYGYPNTPGIYTDEQVGAWRSVTDTVHAKGGFIFCQIWHVGRASHVLYQPDGQQPPSCTDKTIPEQYHITLPDGTQTAYSAPRALTKSEITGIVDDFRRSAANAIRAGFDGVEIHGAHGYLIEQFLKNDVNDRTDAYGGSVENRCRFVLEILEAVSGEIGVERTALRISPVLDHLGASDPDPVALVACLMSRLNEMFSESLAYLHVLEPQFTAGAVKDVVCPDKERAVEEMWRVLKGFKSGWLMRSGGFVKENAEHAVDAGEADLVSFGRHFLANPDLPRRLALGLPLNAYDRNTFYTHDPVVGYIDYPFYDVAKEDK